MQDGHGRRRASDPRYRETVADAAENFLFHLYRGSELLQDNRVHEAKEELETALSLQPRDAKGQDLLAVVYFRLGLYPRAIEIYEELARAYPSDPTLAQNLALCYLKTGQAEKARGLLEPLVMEEPTHLRAWAYLGLVHERLGDYEKARGAFERAGQPAMARRMTDMLTTAAPPHSLSVPPQALRSVATFSVLDPATAGDVVQGASRRSSPPLLLSLEPSQVASASSAGGSLASLGESLAQSQPDAAGSHAEGATETKAQSRVSRCLPTTAPTIADLAREHGLVFPSEPGAAEHPSGLVLVQVESSFAARGSAIRAMSTDGEGFRHSPLRKKNRARMHDELLGRVDDPIVLVSGWGYLVLAARQDYKLVTIRLDDEGIYLHEQALIGFEGGLSYENGRLAVDEGGSLPLVQVRGRGAVVFESRQSFVCLDIAGSLGAAVPEDAVLGWTGRLVPRMLSLEETPGKSERMIAFAGDGTVFVATGPVQGGANGAAQPIAARPTQPIVSGPMHAPTSAQGAPGESRQGPGTMHSTQHGEPAPRPSTPSDVAAPSVPSVRGAS